MSYYQPHVPIPPPIIPDANFKNVTISNQSAALQNIQIPDPVLPLDAVNKQYVDTHSSTPGGLNTQIQYNNSGSFAGSPNLTWDNTLNILTAPNMTVLNAPTNPTDVTNKQYVDSITGAVPGLPFNSVQYNNAGIFTGTSDFTWDNTLKHLTVNGQVIAQAHLSLSDVSTKTNISSLNNDDSLKLLNKIECYRYNLLDSNTESYGVMAQQLEEIGLGNLINQGEKYKSVSYTQLIPLLISSIKKIQEKIEDVPTVGVPSFKPVPSMPVYDTVSIAVPIAKPIIPFKPASKLVSRPSRIARRSPKKYI